MFHTVYSKAHIFTFEILLHSSLYFGNQYNLQNQFRYVLRFIQLAEATSSPDIDKDNLLEVIISFLHMIRVYLIPALVTPSQYT